MGARWQGPLGLLLMGSPTTPSIVPPLSRFLLIWGELKPIQGETRLVGQPMMCPLPRDTLGSLGFPRRAMACCSPGLSSAARSIGQGSYPITWRCSVGPISCKAGLKDIFTVLSCSGPAWTELPRRFRVPLVSLQVSCWAVRFGLRYGVEYALWCYVKRLKVLRDGMLVPFGCIGQNVPLGGVRYSKSVRASAASPHLL